MRTDVHRPSALVASDYNVIAIGEKLEFIDPACDYPQYTLELCVVDRDRWDALGEPTESTWEGHREGQCDCCGGHLKYWSVVEHIPTGDIITVGLDCTDRFVGGDWSWARERLQALAAAKAAERAFLTAHPELGLAYQYCREAVDAPEIAGDIAAKVRERPLSDAQYAVLARTYAAHCERLRPVVESEACPSGKLTLTGRVVSTKWVQTRYGWEVQNTQKMLVDCGSYRVYGTVPAALAGVEAGDTVTFTATVERSDRDPRFGTFSRPTAKRAVGPSAPQAHCVG